MTTMINRRVCEQLRHAAALCLLALAAVLCQANQARAQWTTSGTNTSTTDSVGIGTSSPAAPLDIRVAAGDVITRYSNAGGASGALEMRYKYESTQHRLGL